ncbi:MAG: DUF4190 domain-containing protein [Actinomycetota bacterium]|nr:DUF4190 domain-containing protein [Actinomycetota bacterium]
MDKACPACAEMVRAEAMVCRFCRYDWRTDSFAGLRPRTNGLATASLTLGILSLMGLALVPLSALGGALALIMGALAGRQIRRSNGTMGGAEMAGFGLALGIVALAVAAILGLLAYLLDVEAITVNVSGF